MSVFTEVKLIQIYTQNTINANLKITPFLIKLEKEYCLLRFSCYQSDKKNYSPRIYTTKTPDMQII